ncbi:MAG: hypothetical protein EA376_00630 [Phycisphaeraceae bacterium]|nr:MAG: hypothetical protein EA376_00630 [Phycisphaeraceae bacterium]
MAKPFDPRKILKHIANDLLREFFSRRGELTDIPWDDLTEHKIEPVFDAWQRLPEKERLEVQVILRDINELADHRGMAVLAEEILWRCPERAEEFKAQKGKADKAMWVYLHMRGAFDEAALFARADALAAGRHWKRRNGLPKITMSVDDSMIDALEDALTSFYGPVQMRGRRCKAVHYRRSGGADYFFAYLDDYPDKHMVFDGDSAEPIVRADRYAFQNVFVYNADDGSMEVFAQGGKKVWEPLQSAFCSAVLDEHVDPADPLRPSFKLDHLLTPDFPLPTDPNDRVEEARIKRIKLGKRGWRDAIELTIDPRDHRNAIYRKIELLRRVGLVTDDTQVLSVTFALKFVHDGPGRQPTMTFDVSAPNSSDLKSKPDEQRAIGERCLRQWEVVDDDE